MSINEFIDKWNLGFAANDDFQISSQDLRDFKDDVALLIQESSAGQPLTELVLPQPVISEGLYITSTGIWQARASFTARAAPVPGPNWRRLADFTQVIAAASITDATLAGRNMLTASSATAQLALVDKLDIAAGKYGPHPAFSRVYTDAGLGIFLLQKVMQLLATPVVQTLPQPAAPTVPQVDDTNNNLSGILVPGSASYVEYEGFGWPGIEGIVPFTSANSHQEGDRIYQDGLTGPIDISKAGFRLAASGNRPAGKFMTNPKAFTGPAVVAKGYPATYAATYNPAA